MGLKIWDNRRKKDKLKLYDQNILRCVCSIYKKKKKLDNSLLIAALNPSLRVETTTFSALIKLRGFLSNVNLEEVTLQVKCWTFHI